MTVDDQQLEQLARNLGARAEERLDVDDTARAVVARLKSEHERVVWRRRVPQLSVLAVAAVLFLVVGLLFDDGGEGPVDSGLDLAAMPIELQALSYDELEEVFDSLSFEAPVSELAVANLEDMSIGQLEELLQTMMEE